MSPRFRIAPSPTGFFHVGGARTALFNWALARRLGGRFVLRIEDTDEARNRPEWTQGIIDALAWIGIGADDPAFEGPYFQSANAAAHVAAAERLFADGHAYYCDLTAEEIQARAKASRPAGLRRLLARPRPRARARAGCCGSACPEGATVVHDVVRGEVTFEQRRDRGLRAAARQRHADVPARQRRRRHRDGHHPRRARRGAPARTRPSSSCCGRRSATSRRCGRTCRCSSTSSARSCPSAATRWRSSSYRDEGYLAEAMVNYLMTLGWAPQGDTEIVPW